MRIVTIHRLNESKPQNIIVECDEGDTCPSCGAGYKVNMDSCEYCKEPVQVLRIPQPELR